MTQFCGHYRKMPTCNVIITVPGTDFLKAVRGEGRDKEYCEYGDTDWRVESAEGTSDLQ